MLDFKKKTLLLILLFFLIFPSFCFADDIENEDDVASDLSSILTSSSTSTIPTINSRAAVVIERSTNTVLYGKNENEIRKMASTTKIMTAIVVLESNCDLSETIKVSSKAAGTGGSRLGLSTNCSITVNDLLYGLMLCSGNDAAVALAEHIGGSVEGFAELMNKKAEELHLTNTHFVTPHGLDNENHFTTAFELATLANYALNNETFAKIVRTSNYTVTINGYPKSLHNTNELLGYLDGVYGVKTGFTNGANRCLVTSCKRGDLDIICVVLGADTKKFRTQDSIKLIEYAFSNYKMINLQDIVNSYFCEWKNQNIGLFSVEKGVSNISGIYLDNCKYASYPILNGDTSKISFDVNCKFNYIAPLVQNAELGNFSVLIDNKEIFNLNIYNTQTIGKKNASFYLKNLLKNYSLYLENIFNI